MEIDSMGEDRYKIGSAILSMFDNSSENNKNQPHPTVIESNIKLRKDVIKEFVDLYDTPIAYKNEGSCFCPPMIKAPYLENDPHGLPNYTYECSRTNKAGCGLGVTNKMMSKDRFDKLQLHDRQFLPLYYKRISNGCQLIAGKPIPDGGDCGFTLLSSILLSAPIVTSENILLRRKMDLDYFFPNKNHMNYVQIKAAYKKVDINEMIRCLYAQCTIENIDTISESLIKTPFQEELQEMFFLRNNNTYSLNNIDADDKIKGTSITVSDPRTWLETGRRQKVKKGGTRTGTMLNNIEHSDINVTYNTVVLRYSLEFCSMCKPADVIGFKECCKIYHCMSPQRLGRLGCIWPTDKALQWFEAFI